MRRFLALLALALGIALPLQSDFAGLSLAIPTASSVVGCTINSVSLSTGVTPTFTANTLHAFVGTVSSSLTGTCAADGWSVSGTDAASFEISGTTLQTSTVAGTTLNPGLYHVNVVDTISGATNSPTTLTLTPTGASGTTLTSFTLVNTTGSTVNTVISPFIGLQFKDLDIVSGAWPKFVRHDNSAACVYSWGLKATWKSGSTKHMTVVVRCPGTIAASSSLQVDVQTGGSQPTTSARTITELRNADLAMLGVSSGVNLGAGTWQALLDSTNTCNAWIDGDAGKGWICDGDYKQSGTKQGQLRARWYTFSITDGAGNLGGIRHLSRTWQPYYDVDPKLVLDMSSLSTCTGVTSTSCTSGVSTAVPVQAAHTFTGTSTSSFTATGNTFYAGASDYNVIPVKLTGTLTGLNTTTLYYMQVNKASPNTITFATNPGSGSVISGTCTGTCTATPIYAVQTFGTVFNATTSASYNFCQCGGSLSADATLRFTKDPTYWHGTKMLPPWSSTTLSGNVPAISTFSFNWNPTMIGPLTSAQQAAGGRPDIGPLPAQAVQHFYNQDANGEFVMRAIGLSGALMNFAIRQCAVSAGSCTQFAPVNIGNPNNTYTGFSTNSATTWRYGAGGGDTFPVGTPPVAPANLGVWDLSEVVSHQPSFAYYPYLWGGEPWFLDIQYEMATEVLGVINPGNPYRNPLLPTAGGLSTQHYAIVTSYNSQTRSAAWALREVIHAAGIAPDTSPDGVNYKSYYGDSASESLKWINTATTNINSYFATNGYHGLGNFSAGAPPPYTIITDNSVWQEAYMMMAAEFGAAILESTDAQTVVNNKATWYAHQGTTFGYWSLYSFYELSGNNDTPSPITADTQWGGMPALSSMTWASTHPNFTVTVNSGSNYVPTAGDIYIFPDAGYCVGGSGVCGQAIGGITPFNRYFVRDVTSLGGGNYTFNVASTLNGTAVTITNSGTVNVEGGSFMQPSQTISTGTPTGGIDQESYAAEVYAVGVWAQALGLSSTINATVTDANNRLTTGGVYNCSTAANVEFCMQNSY